MSENKPKTEDKNTKTSLLMKLAIILVTIIVFWNLYKGATVSEIGIPGLFTIKFGDNKTPTPTPTVVVTPTIVPTPTSIPTQRSVQIKGIRITDERGNTIQPMNNVYAMKLGETVTIAVDIINPDNHEIGFIWQGKLVKVADTFTQKTFYTATKPGSEVITVYVRDKETDEKLYKSISVTVTAE